MADKGKHKRGLITQGRGQHRINGINEARGAYLIRWSSIWIGEKSFVPEHLNWKEAKIYVREFILKRQKSTFK